MNELITFLKAFHFANELWTLLLPVIMMGIDILTGLIYAWISHSFKSSEMRSGLGKKIGEIAILVIGELFSFALGIPRYIMSGISVYIVFMEFMSVFENLKALRVPIPRFVDVALTSVDKAVNESEDVKAAGEALEKLAKDMETKDES